MAQIHKYICQSDGSFGCLEEIDYQQRRVNIFYIYLLRFHVIYFSVNSTLKNNHRKRAINLGKSEEILFNLPLIYSFQLLTTHLSLSRILYFNLKIFEIIFSEKFNGLPFLPQQIHPGWLLPTKILK